MTSARTNVTSASNGGSNQQNASFGLLRDAFGRLMLIDADGVRYADISVLPLFPLTDPGRWIALIDASGSEIACIADLAELNDASRALLEEQLAQRQFLPVIDRILRVSGNSEPCEWQVQTDRGETTFVLKSEDDVRRLSSFQVLVVDGHGIRYLIPDYRNLDAKSRRIVEWYV